MPSPFRCLLPALLLIIICAGNNACSKPAVTPVSGQDTIGTIPHDTTAGQPKDTTTNHPKDTTVTLPVDTASFAVYVAGDTMISGYESAAYWKNGVITQVPAQRVSYITGMYVYNKDVYSTIAGANYTGGFNYWKNNIGFTEHDTIGGACAAYAVTVSDGNIYTTGTTHERPDGNYAALYWKNNDYAVHLVPREITIHQSSGNAIAVANGDVYVAGYLDLKAVYWKNSQVIHLQVDTMFTYNYSTANSIILNNGDVYIAGSENLTAQFMPGSQCRAVYWKNNKLTTLTRDTGSVANAILVVNNDVYVVGGIYGADGLTRAAYWKNGVLVPLHTAYYSIANAIVVHGSDVYIAGTIGYNQATYWKNGVAVSLGVGQANAIFIVSK